MSPHLRYRNNRNDWSVSGTVRDWAKLHVDGSMNKDRKHSRFCFFFFFFLPPNRTASRVFFITGKDGDFRHMQLEATGKAALDHQPHLRHKWFHSLSFTQSNRFLSQPLLYTWCSTLARKTALLDRNQTQAKALFRKWNTAALQGSVTVWKPEGEKTKCKTNRKGVCFWWITSKKTQITVVLW